MNFLELTDPDGDALTITSDFVGTWITCTSGGEEVTVGPFPAVELRAAWPDVHLSRSFREDRRAHRRNGSRELAEAPVAS